MPQSADYMMYWWHRAAQETSASRTRRFGLITTNSLPQAFNRRVVQAHLEHVNGISLAFAIPDHPWVNASDSAAVRIAMTVGAQGPGDCLRSGGRRRYRMARRKSSLLNAWARSTPICGSAPI
jgi:hypothetical protein